MNETTPSEGLERLKSHLRSLTFARIQRVVARDEHLMSFVALDGFEWERN